MPLTLRPYQMKALNALEEYLERRDDNPCVVLPTGSGKSYVIAELIRRRMVPDPHFRCVVLAPRKELVDQNYKEFKNLVGQDIDAGIYCAGLGQRNIASPIVFATINSVYRRASAFPSVDMVIVDEAHHIPVRNAGDGDEGMYRMFLNGIKERSPRLRIVGFTATPYRLDVGHVCHRDYILNEMCYEANVSDLIRDKYLCRLRSKVSKLTPDLNGVTESGGDYKLEELSERACVADLVRNTVEDAISRLNAERRKCCVWFCVDVKHCEMVKNALSARGERVGMVTGETEEDMRTDITERFRQGSIRHLLNVQVFTEGFNVKQVDAIVLLRPTLSRGLFVQMVGRGLRLHPDKDDCIVLDYARCIEEHGPIDQKSDQYVPMEICCRCGELFARERRECPCCGYVVPEEEVRKHEARDEKKKRVCRLHDEIVSCREILAQEYADVNYGRVVNTEKAVKLRVLALAYTTARNGYEYRVRHNRKIPANNLGEMGKFLKEFVEYAKYVELTDLPEMLRDYFESESIHKFERRRIKREEKERRLEELKKAMGFL